MPAGASRVRFGIVLLPEVLSEFGPTCREAEDAGFELLGVGDSQSVFREALREPHPRRAGHPPRAPGATGHQSGDAASGGDGQCHLEPRRVSRRPRRSRAGVGRQRALHGGRAARHPRRARRGGEPPRIGSPPGEPVEHSGHVWRVRHARRRVPVYLAAEGSPDAPARRPRGGWHHRGPGAHAGRGASLLGAHRGGRARGGAARRGPRRVVARQIQRGGEPRGGGGAHQDGAGGERQPRLPLHPGGQGARPGSSRAGAGPAQGIRAPPSRGPGRHPQRAAHRPLGADRLSRRPLRHRGHAGGMRGRRAQRGGGGRARSSCSRASSASRAGSSSAGGGKWCRWSAAREDAHEPGLGAHEHRGVRGGRRALLTRRAGRTACRWCFPPAPGGGPHRPRRAGPAGEPGAGAAEGRRRHHREARHQRGDGRLPAGAFPGRARRHGGAAWTPPTT